MGDLVIAAAVIVGAEDLLERLRLHPPRKCQTDRCEHEPVPPKLGGLDQTGSKLLAAHFECLCGWSRLEPLLHGP